MPQDQGQTTTAAALRHLAQAVQSLDAETPRVEIGSREAFDLLEDELGVTLPEDVRQLYLDSNPAALTVPMPVDDIEFIPLAEVSALRDDLELEDGYLPVALESEAPYAIELGSGEVVVGTQTSQGWDWETIALSITDFLSALAAIAESFAATKGETLATRFEVGTDAEIHLEERLAAIDPEHADRWLEWLA
ncbi:MAG: hypothetical protein DCC49_01210 [Acidobacteria bacterium]|nr:MAG: hypothetical protein DCC49_01210 [Acidobacteriota bacterium]